VHSRGSKWCVAKLEVAADEQRIGAARVKRRKRRIDLAGWLPPQTTWICNLRGVCGRLNVGQCHQERSRSYGGGSALKSGRPLLYRIQVSYTRSIGDASSK